MLNNYYVLLSVPDHFDLNMFLRGSVSFLTEEKKNDLSLDLALMIDLICDTEKMHSIKHAAQDVASWGDTDNTNVEAPEVAHKNSIRQ